MDNPAHVRDSRQPGHFWADNEIVDEYLPVIGIYGFAVYMLLAKFADSKTGQCDPSVTGIATRLGISTPTARTALEKLKEAKLITIRHRSRERDGRVLNQTSVYTLLAIRKAQKDVGTKPGLVPNDIDQGVLNQVDQGTKGDLVGVLNQVSTNKTHKNKTQLTRESGQQLARTPALHAYFETFSGQSLSAAQVKEINSAVTDIVHWQRVLKEWALNGWNPKSIGKMLDRYSSGASMSDERPGGNRQQGNGRPPADLPMRTAADSAGKEIATPEERKRIVESEWKK